MPKALGEYLVATDGFLDVGSAFEYGWTLVSIADQNARAWADKQSPFDRDLVAFGEDGAGGWFAIRHGAGEPETILHWSWIELKARQVAPDLLEFWRGWLGGSITV